MSVAGCFRKADVLKNCQSPPIFLYQQPIDMRKSIDGLSVLATEHFDSAPTSGSLYVFCNRGKDKIKILYWDRNGFCLWYKRLEQERFQVSYSISGVIQLDQQQLGWLIDGLDYKGLQGHKFVNYSAFY